MRIIYVEDNMANVHLVRRVARMGNHEVINYIDGMDALNNFGTDKPDLVLMDIQLAGELTGIEVVQKLREQGFTTPIIAVTAYAMIGDKERCMEAGCTGYMSKPIPVTDLVKLFEEYESSQADETAEPEATVTEDKPAEDTSAESDSPETKKQDESSSSSTEAKLTTPPTSSDDADKEIETQETKSVNVKSDNHIVTDTSDGGEQVKL